MLEDEDRFLRRLVVRLRGAQQFALAPETKMVFKETITAIEERLTALDEERHHMRRKPSN